MNYIIFIIGLIDIVLGIQFDGMGGLIIIGVLLIILSYIFEYVNFKIWKKENKEEDDEKWQ